MQVLVVNCQRNGLGVIRSLGAHGVDVIAVDHSRRAPGVYSRYVKRRQVVTSPKVDQDAFIRELVALGQAARKGDKILLLPTNDEYVLTMAKHWDRLAGHYLPIFETDMNVLLDCTDKTRMYKVAARAGVPHPRTLYSPLDPAQIAALAFPVVVKPFNTRSPANQGKQIFRIRFCQNTAEVTEATGLLERQDVAYVVQEFIPGGDDELYTAGIVAYEGELLGAFTGRKLRQFPPHTGECSYGEIVDTPRVTELAAQFVRTAGFTGIAQVEFKHHDGEYYLIEINPRSWSWNSLATFAGVNLPWIGCNAVLGNPQSLVTQTRMRGTWSYAYMDIQHNLILNRNMTLRQAARQILTADCHAHWQISDPAPAFVYAASLLKLVVRR